MLGVSYSRVRSLGRGLLSVVWSYVLVSAIIAAAIATVPEDLKYGSLRASWVTVACWAAILAAVYLLRVRHPIPPSVER